MKTLLPGATTLSITPTATTAMTQDSPNQSPYATIGASVTL